VFEGKANMPDDRQIVPSDTSEGMTRAMKREEKEEGLYGLLSRDTPSSIDPSSRPVDGDGIV
jgi:hypothetical protein